MGKEARTFDRSLLEKAQDDLVHGGGTPRGQSCHFEAEVWHELRALVAANLRGETYYIGEGQGDASD